MDARNGCCAFVNEQNVPVHEQTNLKYCFVKEHMLCNTNECDVHLHKASLLYKSDKEIRTKITAVFLYMNKGDVRCLGYTNPSSKHGGYDFGWMHEMTVVFFQNEQNTRSVNKQVFWVL